MATSTWRRRRRLIACAGALAAGAPALRALAADGTRLVNIGFAGGLGNKLLTNLSFSARDGALLAIEEANQRKIVIGGQLTRFALLPVDDQSDINFARLVANSFVSAKVAAVIGHNTTETSVATTPIYADAGIALISPTSTGRQFTSRGYKNVFQLLGHSDVTCEYLADVAANIIRARRIALLENGTSLGAALAEGFIRNLKSQGQKIILRDAVTPKTSDFNAALTLLKNSDPDLVFFTGGGPQIQPFLQNFQRMKLRCQLLMTGGALNSEFPHTGPYPEGAYLLTHGLPPDRRPGYADFEKAYRRRFDTSINSYTMFAYDAAGMAIEAMQKLDSADSRLVLAELHRMKYKGISGNVAFATDGSQLNPPYTLYRAEQKNWRPLKSWGG